jgi:hypothetical protein
MGRPLKVKEKLAVRLNSRPTGHGRECSFGEIAGEQSLDRHPLKSDVQVRGAVTG